ncbi:SMI1/KNR4 family protein [Actinoplanes solisilvae]|uniref:SMI1/KNR4 family protein n=1 Tax=Actinoplanes solisilvae TaxID=2486853 RepID=UPI0013E398F2|nr:SMI1/KNR4 family protein [Actinoplanes solisilvae]
MSDEENGVVVFEQLRHEWMNHRAPVADHLRPGLDDSELDAVEASTGLVLPSEMRRWWGWHDGVQRRVPGTALGPESRLGAGGWDLLSLSEALAHRASLIELTAEFVEDDEVRWLPEWLPVVGYDSNYLFITAGAPRAPHSSVRLWARTPDDPYTVRAPSWIAAVAVFTELLRGGEYTFDPSSERWNGPERLPADPNARKLL